ncbi:MAG: ATP-binding protein [Acidobacteria bacterium]|nr:MAG: ATP-binding protein [Acidobacteriota bacterium]
MPGYEKIGAFYLGREHSLEEVQGTEPLVLYDSRDLVTHAVCVGMTGSGKTGLCIGLLEEAAIDGIPSLVIDPKGDLSNLLLTFPELLPEDFLPWVNADDASRKGLELDAFAAQQADLWRQGLSSWEQDGERIRRLKAAADFAIYTPGSEAGLPVSILASFAAPTEAVRADRDLLGDRIASTVTSVLGLLGIDADPIRSREHILLSTILDNLWQQDIGADLASLIRVIQEPPFKQVGVLDLESFYPAKERFELAMKLNNLLAAPGFQTWLEGDPLDPGELLYTSKGKPRVAIMSIAHLSERERMFFVSLLLNQVVDWMRTCPGTTSLRALLYMDEIFGFFPPVAEPPSKRPLLTLLKQARAYGLGVVLATQNPVDLDYKGLSNTGTWFLGRLQTEQDRERVLDGLEGITAAKKGFDRKTLSQILGSVGKRVFLLHNVHQEAPVLFHTRWVMSYLRGPLTRDQIARLMADKKATVEGEAQAPAPPVADRTPESTVSDRATETTGRPTLPPDITDVVLPAEGTSTGLAYRPGVLGIARVDFVDRKSRETLDAQESSLFHPLDEEMLTLDWGQASELGVAESDLDNEPEPGAAWDPVPKAATKAKSYSKWGRQLADHLYRNSQLELFKSPTFKLIAEPGESERDFRIRLADQAREERDRRVEELRAKHTTKVEKLEERLRRARQKLEKEKEQASREKLQTVISVGTTLLSVFTGGKKLSKTNIGKAQTAARGVGRASKEAGDVDRAEEDLDTLSKKLEELHKELESEVQQLEERFDPEREELEIVTVRPRKSDIDVRLVTLAWDPRQE